MSTVTRATLSEQICMRAGLSRSESAEILDSVLEIVSAALERGETVKLSGFGTFMVRQKGQRSGRNPRTGVEVPILPRSVLVFRPSQILRSRTNGVEVGIDDSDDFLESEE